MAKKLTFTINGERFEKKTDLEDYIRNIVARYKDNQPLDWFDLPFVLDLLGNHAHAENKIGCGVAAIVVRRNPVYRQNRGFVLQRTDGTETDFSWRECIKPTPHSKKVRIACRALVEPYTRAFKQKFFDECGDEAVCPITGESIRFLGSHVDHEPPMTFEAIFRNFVKEYRIDIDRVELKDVLADNKYYDELTDPEIIANWIDYHTQHATLRVVSAKANLSNIKASEL